MAKLATKPHLVASLNVMLAAREGDEALTQEEIVEILSAMAETDAMASNPQPQQRVHWQQAPRRVI
ncbi:MAG: hypothetical protein D6790_11210 [Caldilineae bacterium]|nr:MAG: hypothetical protein D6790_11210 [Caldilineae bacterium]